MIKVGKKVFVLLLTAALAVCLGGCMRKSKKVISYMEDRYGKTFTYIGETNGMFGRRTFTAQLSCPDYPESVILASWMEQDGEEGYADNYLAFRFHNDAAGQIEETIGQVFMEYQLLFPVPKSLMTIEKPETYTLKDYLADPLTFKSVYILVYEEVDQAAFQALMKAFENAGISVQGLVAVPQNRAEAAGLTEDTVDDFLAHESRVRTQVNFSLENGVVTYEDWRQLS